MHHPGHPAGLQPSFEPKSIAVLGASSDPAKIGGRPVHYLRAAGFAGRIFPVNPAHRTVQGLAAHRHVLEIDSPIDLAIVAVPKEHVMASLQSCFEAGVRAAVVFSAGFAETGEAGRTQQARIAALAREHDARVVGPNCMGIINARNGVLATFTGGLNAGLPAPGNISLASQSGAFGAHCLVLARQRGLALGLWATTGNEADVDVADMMAYMAQDPGTDVVVCCIEGVRDGQRLVRALEIAKAHGKPVVMMKIGSSEIGAAAAASHTASLAGSDKVFDAVLREFDVYRAFSIDELFDVACAFSRMRPPANDKLGILTVSGGVGVILADEAARRGVDMPALPEDTQQRLKGMVSFAATRNPVDVTAQLINDASLLQPMFEALAGDGNYGSIIAFLSHIGLDAKMVDKLFPAFEAIAAAYPERVLIISMLAHPETRARFEALGYLVVEDPSRAVGMAAALIARAKVMQQPVRRPAPTPAVTAHVIPGAALSEFDARGLLRAAGIPVLTEHLVHDIAQAEAASTQIGFPIAMKVVSPDLPHKSDLGGVALGLEDAAAVRRAFTSIQDAVAEQAPQARIEGILVSPMAAPGLEMILGSMRDPVFGPVVMAGFGGIFAEILDDTVLARAPLDIDQAKDMILRLRGRDLLLGSRGQPPADTDALAAALASLSRFAAANADALETVDINPLRVYPRGQGVQALDALVVSRAAESASTADSLP